MGYIYFKHFMNKKFLILIIFLFFAIIGLVVGCGCQKHKAKEPEIIIRPQEEQPIVLRRKIDGQIVDSEEKINDQYPVAIMIENSADAWPLTGVNKARLVIEAITEASIPRFVAIYTTDEEVEKIGPVRSARPYYLDWIEPLAPLYMHVGGAPEALTKLKSGQYDLINFDQFFNSEYYWRDNKWRYAPHNVYTSTELIKEALTDKELNQAADYTLWNYKDDLALEERPQEIQDITVLYSSDYYRVDWKYNREENNYIRYQHQNIQKMSDGEWIKVKNIIVQVNEMSIIDDVGRKKIETVGEGKAWFFRDGQMIEGKWQKESKDTREKYLDNDGKEVEFNAGMTWIEVVPEEDCLKY